MYTEHILTDDCPSSVSHIDIYQSTHDSLSNKTTAIDHCHGNSLCNETAQPSAACQTFHCVLASFVPLLNQRQKRLSLTTSGQTPTTDQSRMEMVVKERKCDVTLWVSGLLFQVRVWWAFFTFGPLGVETPLKSMETTGKHRQRLCFYLPIHLLI